MAVPKNSTVQEEESSKKKQKSNAAKYEGSSKLRRNARREFAEALSRSREEFSDPENLPSLEAAYEKFISMFPRFMETSEVDNLRAAEYDNLRDRVCLDYSGFGLFSHRQRTVDADSSSFRLSYVSASLPTHALYGAADEGTIEAYIRTRIMDYLRINENDYSMVFTASKSSAVMLLAESYRFDTNGRLLVNYDHHSQSIDWMMQCAKDKGAKVINGVFQWPSLRINSRHLRKELQKKSKKDGFKGLFVFPPQSRVTGAKYSYQWISLAQQNHWHVLLDASAVGPRDMDALGLSVFSPDFIVSSFYKVFGADPTGFGCLFVKKTTIQSLCNSSKARAVGMVRILSCSPSISQHDKPQERFLSGHDPSALSSFSGPLSIDDYRNTDDFSALMQSNFKSNLSEPESSPTGTESSEHESESPCSATEPDVSSEASEEPCSSTSVDIKGKGKVWDEDVGEVAGPSRTKELDSSRELESIREEEIVPVENEKIFTLKELLAVSDDEYIAEEHQPSINSSIQNDSLQEDSSLILCCKALDQSKVLGMSKLRNRLRYLVNWLVISLQKFRHPSGSRTHLVQVYGPRGRYDKGACIAFNLYDWSGLILEPVLVQKLADRNNVSLGLGVVKNVQFEISPRRLTTASHKSTTGSFVKDKVELVVLSISLGFVSAFEDVYKLWVFVSKFLDVDFVQKEVWRYQGLNQELVALM